MNKSLIISTLINNHLTNYTINVGNSEYYFSSSINKEFIKKLNDKLSFEINYDISSKNYIIELPNEMICYILFYIDDNTTFKNLIDTEMINQLNNNNYRYVVRNKSFNLYNDLMEIFNKFTSEYKWKDIYESILNINISTLLTNLDINDKPISLDNSSINDLYEFRMMEDINNSNPLILLYSLKIKYIFPNLYDNLLKFVFDHTNDINKWLMVMKALISIIINKDKRLIEYLTGKRKNPISVIDRRFMLINDRLHNLLISRLLLWYFLNCDGILLDGDGSNNYNLYLTYNILEILYGEIPFNLVVLRLSDSLLNNELTYMLNMRNNRKKNVKQPLNEMISYLTEEKVRRNI